MRPKEKTPTIPTIPERSRGALVKETIVCRELPEGPPSQLDPVAPWPGRPTEVPCEALNPASLVQTAADPPVRQSPSSPCLSLSRASNFVSSVQTAAGSPRFASHRASRVFPRSNTGASDPAVRRRRKQGLANRLALPTPQWLCNPM